MTHLTLVHGGSSDAREAAIAANADPARRSAAILEGVASTSEALNALAESTAMKVIRVAPGCPCCSGNLTMRITLNRVLREKPAQLFVAIADARHKIKVREFLQDAQYREHLKLGPELDCSQHSSAI